MLIEKTGQAHKCLDRQQQTLFQKAPRDLVRVTGQEPLDARVHTMQPLRCHLCANVFTASLTANIGQPLRKSTDAAAANAIALLKYHFAF